MSSLHASLAGALVATAVSTTLAANAPAADAPVPVAQDGASETAITIYSSADPAGFDPQRYIAQQRMGSNPNMVWQVPGFGVVRETRTVAIEPGRSQLRFTDVAQFIDPTTVSFTDRTDPNTGILDQRFEFDLVSPSKLLERYLDREITVRVAEGDSARSVSGTLLSATQGALVIRTESGIEIVQGDLSRIQLGELPDGFVTKPTLVWNLDARSGGNHVVETAYRTGGLTWRADYNLVLSGDDRTVDLAAWVSLLNLSGASWSNATLKLVAGDVQTIQPRQPVREMMMRGAVADADGSGGFEQKAFFEYHLYTLGRPIDVDSNTVQQIALFPTRSGVPVTKRFVFEGQPNFRNWTPPRGGINDGDFDGGNSKVDVFLRFVNDEASKLGIPLPKGRVRVLKEDPADGSLEFIGEDLIDHTPRDERVQVRLGNAFDVVGERTRTNFTVDRARRTATETVRIEIRNRKENEPVSVTVREHLWRSANWTITRETRPHAKRDSNTIEFTVDVAPGQAGTVEYTVSYTW